MSSDYTTTISQIAEVYDGPHATPKKTDIGPYFLSISSLTKGALDLSQSAHLSEDEFKKWTKRVTPREGDVLFSYETRLGEAALMPSGIRACLGRRMGLLRPDRSKVIPEYLLYAYLAPEFQSNIEQRKIHGATVDRIALKELPYFPIRIPTLEEQNQVVRVLSSLDSKTQLNHQTNQTLEQMAQAIFKSWFVNFEPVRAKIAILEAGGSEGDALLSAMQTISGKDEEQLTRLQNEQPEQYAELRTTAELFPSAMRDSDLGEIPEGWSIEPFSAIARLDTTSVKPAQEPEKVWEHYSIPAFDEGTSPAYDTGDEIKSNKYKVYPTAILSSKLNPHFPRTWVPDIQNSDAAICSTEFMQFVPLEPQQRAFIAGMITSEPFQSGILMRVTGSTGSRQRAQPKQVAAVNVVLPSNELRESYSRRTDAMYSMQSKNIWQAQSLAGLRDALLPRLLAGELSVGVTEDQRAKEELVPQQEVN